MKLKYVFLALGILHTTFASAQLPAPAPVPKDGDCPANYAAEGSACVPKAGAQFVIAKSVICPEGYDIDGNYCVATASARLAIRRAAMSCPSGYEPTGNYCLSNK